MQQHFKTLTPQELLITSGGKVVLLPELSRGGNGAVIGPDDDEEIIKWRKPW